MMKQQNRAHDFAKRLNQHNYQYDTEMVLLREEAKAEAKRLSAAIKSRIPGVSIIWGFGSVFEKNRPFSKTSDIDLALEGGDFFAVYRIVEQSSFKVDLIDITGKNDRFASLIRKNGVNLLTGG